MVNSSPEATVKVQLSEEKLPVEPIEQTEVGVGAALGS
jgi:hypothetical protein